MPCVPMKLADMATPSASRIHSTPTPKNSMAVTPTNVTSSPRPGTSATMSRPFSHKSPSIKTPASGHGHSHHLSISSHPSSTPLAAPILGEGVLPSDSPDAAAAALMASLGSHGLTPLPSGHDGLSISAGLQATSADDDSVIGGRDLEEEKSHRLQKVIKALEPKRAGRGIDRAGVARLAQLSGFTYLWDDDVLIIAGNHVGLDITFDRKSRDVVNDVVLKISIAGTEEHKKDASAVLKKDLEPSPPESQLLLWNNLDAFAANLSSLGQVDHLSQGVNCFEAIGGLYHSFKKIWDEEKKRLRGTSTLRRICQGTLGRPRMNKKRRVGLSLDYWAEKRGVNEIESPQLLDATETDNDRHTPGEDRPVNLWSARVRCEAGFPPMRVAKDWVADNVFDEENSKDGVLSAAKVNWLDPDPTIVACSDMKDTSSSMKIEPESIKIPKSPNVRFLIDFTPNVLIPCSVVSSLTTQGLMIDIEDRRFVTYQQALQSLTASGHEKKENEQPRRWLRAIKVVDESGEAHTVSHTYAVYSGNPLWCCYVQSMVFEHPRQLAEIIPTLREYALVWSILCKLVSRPIKPAVGAEVVKEQKSSTKKPQGRTQRKSNRDARRDELETMLGVNASTNDQPQPIDISLSLSSSSPPAVKLDLIIPMISSLGKGTLNHRSHFASVGIEIGINGNIIIVSANGVPSPDPEVMERKLARVLGLSEDLGVLVQWLLDRPNFKS